MSAYQTMRLLAGALVVLAAACSSDDTPAVSLTAPSLTTVAPLTALLPPGSAPPATAATTVAPSPTPPSATAAPLDDPKPTVERFVPVLTLEGGAVALDIVFVDGSRSMIEWPVTLDLVSEGVIPYGWAFIPGGSSRDFFVRPGTVDSVLERLGGADLQAEYRDGAGVMVGLWRPQEDEVDYLAFEFGNWTVLVYDYRNELQMSEEHRALWATNFHGEVTESGFLVLSADHPLQLVFAGDYPAPLNMTLHGADGEVQLTPGACEPGVMDGIDSDAFAVWCTVEANMTIQAYGTRDFQQAVADGLIVRSVVIAEPPPPPEVVDDE